MMIYTDNRYSQYTAQNSSDDDLHRQSIRSQVRSTIYSTEKFWWWSTQTINVHKWGVQYTAQNSSDDDLHRQSIRSQVRSTIYSTEQFWWWSTQTINVHKWGVQHTAQNSSDDDLHRQSMFTSEVYNIQHRTVLMMIYTDNQCSHVRCTIHSTEKFWWWSTQTIIVHKWRVQYTAQKSSDDDLHRQSLFTSDEYNIQHRTVLMMIYTDNQYVHKWGVQYTAQKSSDDDLHTDNRYVHKWGVQYTAQKSSDDDLHRQSIRSQMRCTIYSTEQFWWWSTQTINTFTSEEYNIQHRSLLMMICGHFEHMLKIYLHRHTNKQITFVVDIIEIKRYCTIVSLITFL